MTSLRRLDELRVDARCHRERRDLYRAKMHGPRPTSAVQLKELERACVLSEARLRRAEQEHEAEVALRKQLDSALPSGMLEIDTVRGGDDLSLRLSGELDSAFVGRVEEAIRVAEKSTARAIVVDLSDLQFMDSAGLTMLLKAHARTRQDGQTLRFVPSSHHAVTQLIAVTRTSRMFG